MTGHDRIGGSGLLRPHRLVALVRFLLVSLLRRGQSAYHCLAPFHVTCGAVQRFGYLLWVGVGVLLLVFADPFKQFFVPLRVPPVNLVVKGFLLSLVVREMGKKNDVALSPMPDKFPLPRKLTQLPPEAPPTDNISPR